MISLAESKTRSEWSAPDRWSESSRTDEVSHSRTLVRIKFPSVLKLFQATSPLRPPWKAIRIRQNIHFARLTVRINLHKTHMLCWVARKCRLRASRDTQSHERDAQTLKNESAYFRGSSPVRILESLYRFMPMIPNTENERGESESRLLSETSVWSPLTASPSSIYYKDRAASGDALSIRREAGFGVLKALI